MNNPKVKYGDIYSANHTGHEVVISASRKETTRIYFTEWKGTDTTLRFA